MRIRGISRSFAREVMSSMELYAQLFELHSLKPRRISGDMYAAENGRYTFLLTHSGDDFIVVDALPLSGNVRLEVLKNGSIKKLMEIKRGSFLPFDELLGGAAEFTP